MEATVALDVASMDLEALADAVTKGGITALEEIANTGEIPAEKPNEAAPPADEGATPAAAEATPPPVEEKEHAAAVANKSGTGTIPYAVLKGARERASQVEADNALLRKQLDEMTQRVDSAAPAEQAAKAEVATEQVDTQIAAMQAQAETLKEDFPELASLLAGQIEMLRETRNQLLELKDQTAKEKQQRDSDDQAVVAETMQEAIDGNDVLATWQGKAGAEWDAAVAVDGLLRSQPEWANKSFADRFAKVVDMVKVMHPEFEVPATAPPPASNEKKLQAPATEKRPPVNSLSDIPGGAAPANGKREQVEELSGSALGNRFMDMTSEQINEYLASLAT